MPNQLITLKPREPGAPALQESVAFNPLNITDRRKFVDFLCEGRTPEIVALNAGKPLAWINTLDDDCYNRLAKLCIDLNFKKAMEMVMSDPIAFLKIGPTMLQIQEALKFMTPPDSAASPASFSPAGSASPTTPPPTAAAVATSAAPNGTPPPNSGAT